MLSLIVAVVAGIGVGKVVDLALMGAKALAGKTDTKKDDKFVAFLQEHSPDLVGLAEKVLGLRKPATPAPREQKRDHR